MVGQALRTGYSFSVHLISSGLIVSLVSNEYIFFFENISFHTQIVKYPQKDKFLVRLKVP